MTTVLGIRPDNLNAGILVSDTQGTRLDLHQKTSVSKLYVAKSGDFAFGIAGGYDERTHEFIQEMMEGKIDVPKIIAQGTFREFRDLNIQKMGNRVPDLKSLVGCLLLTRFDNAPLLHTCFPMGSVEPRILTYVGSGSEYVEEYVKASEVAGEVNTLRRRNSKGLAVPSLIKYGLDAVKYAASKDLYSNGLDLVVVTPDGINCHGEDLVDNSFDRRVRKIQSRYRERKD